MVFGVTHRAGHLPTLMRLMLFESLQSGAPVFITSDFTAPTVKRGPLRPLRGSHFVLRQPDAYGAGAFSSRLNAVDSVGS